MIQISRTMVRALRAVLRKSAPVGTSRSHRPALVMHASEQGLRIRAHHAEVAIEWHLPGSLPPDELVLPCEALADLEGRQESRIDLASKGDGILQAHWVDGGVPQCRDYATLAMEKLPPFPAEPARFGSLDAAFLKAYDDAAKITAHDSVRFALTRVQVRGHTGEMIGTNGSQLLLQRGFQFPWKEEVLIPSIGVFGCRELIQEGAIRIGRTQSHVCIWVGSWKFHLAIDKEARFPRIENVIPATHHKGTICHIAPEDASFLVQALPRLPGRDDANEQITVDLNGKVAIRARDEASRVTELLLTRSEAIGPAVQFTSQRQCLARALQLGFSEFQITRADVPIVCRDQKRIYLWMPLDKSTAILPREDAIRIESTASMETVSAKPSTERRIKPMPVPNPNGHMPKSPPESSSPDSDRNLSLPGILSEAEELRAVMQDASARLYRLIHALKQHRRQNRAMTAAMQSLRQLKLDG